MFVAECIVLVQPEFDTSISGASEKWHVHLSGKKKSKFLS
uniref:Uncharacterized protein n=1 Tax=Arundo donax TaxID=35708 RepID=A0A0A8YS08_ARUDO